MSLTIPEFFYPVAELIAGFDSKKTERLADALRKTSPSLSITKISNSISVDDIFEDENSAKDLTENLIEFLFSLFRVQSTLGLNPQELIDDFDEADFSEELPDVSLEAFKENLYTLISTTDSLKISAKATGLFAENKWSYRNSRVIVDVRPIFSDTELVSEPNYALLNHSLKIVCVSEKGPRELYISMDRADLESMKDKLERAIEKDKVITEKMTSNGIKILDSDDLNGQ